MENIERSEKIIAMILLKLQPNGVVQSNLHSSMFRVDGEFDSDLFHYAIRWLKNEGILYYETNSPMTSSFSGVALSSKGYATLNNKFFTNNDVTTLEVAKSISDGSSNFSNAGDFLGGLLGGFTKSISS